MNHPTNDEAGPAPLDRLLRRAKVLDVTALSTSGLYAAMAEGRFPRPLRIGRNAVAWRESEVRAWMDGQPRAEPTGSGDGGDLPPAA